jgi:hypothetical protein
MALWVSGLVRRSIWIWGVTHGLSNEAWMHRSGVRGAAGGLRDVFECLVYLLYENGEIIRSQASCSVICSDYCGLLGVYEHWCHSTTLTITLL